MGIIYLIFFLSVLKSLYGGRAGSIRCFEMFQVTQCQDSPMRDYDQSELKRSE